MTAATTPPLAVPTPLLASAGNVTQGLNQAELAALRRTQPRLLGKMLQIYVQHAPLMITKMQTALAAGDTAALKSGAHSLKSSSANCTATRLSKLCQELEHSALGNAADLNQALVAGVVAEFQLVVEAIAAERASLDAAAITPRVAV